MVRQNISECPKFLKIRPNYSYQLNLNFHLSRLSKTAYNLEKTSFEHVEERLN